VASPLNVWIRRIGIPSLVAVLAVVLFPFWARLIGPFLGVSVWAAAAVGYVFIFLGVPFLFWIVGKACYRIFLKPYVRARRIRMLRERRLLNEAAARAGTAEH